MTGRRLAMAVVLFGIAGGAAGTDPEPPWVQAEQGYAWSFPRDHWAHPGYAIEWWYFTGHLRSRSEPARSFGYQFTIFRIGGNNVEAVGVRAPAANPTGS